MPRPVPVRRPVPAARAPELDGPPRPDLLGSVLCLLGLGATALYLQGHTPVDVARFAAWGVLISITISVAMDLRRGIQNVIRADIIALTSLYFLTLTEFLVSQKQFNGVAAMASTRIAVRACIIAYAGVVVGRHLISPRTRNPLQGFLMQPVPSSVLFAIFWVCMLAGYLNMLIAVHFRIIDMVEYWLLPRFWQPWQRGKFGDWMAMLYEMSMILYLVPPLGGILLARRKQHSKWQVFLVMLGVLFTLFYGFSSGTRNIFASYLVTFLIGYGFAAGLRRTKEIVIAAVLTAMALVVSTKVMLDFRDYGLYAYFVGGYYKDPSHTDKGQSLAVDNNLYAITRMVEYFPEHHHYTGLEIPYLALIHPIPRILWPKKPTGMSISVEDIFGATDWTVATSVVGEEYMMGGYPAIFLMSVFFGFCCAWWNLLASPKNSEFGILVYASGFYSAAITMRSMNWFSTALLPTLAGLVLGYLFMRYHKNKLARIPPPVPRRKIAPAPR